MRATGLVLTLAGMAFALSEAVAQEGSTPKPAAPIAESVPSAPRIGVVDFVKVVDAYPRAIEERKKIEDLRQKQVAAIEAEVKKLREMDLKRDGLLRGTAERDLEDHRYRLKEAELEGLKQIFDREWRRRIEEFSVAMYEDMQRAVEIVAKDRGVQLVLRAHADGEASSLDGKARLMEARVIWFASEEIDLTAAVIKRLQLPLPPKAGATQGPAGSSPEAKKQDKSGG